MTTYSVDDLARSIIAMYLSNALQKDMEKRGFTPVKAGQDPSAAGMMPPPMGGMPPMDMAGMAPPGGPMPPGAPPMGGPPVGGPPMGGPPGAMPPGPGGPGPIAGAGDLGSLMGLLGAMPPPPPPEGKPEEKPEGAPKEEPEPEETAKGQKAEVTPTTLYAELVKVRKLLVGIYDALNLKIPSAVLSDEEVYLSEKEKEEIRQSPKEKEQTTPALSPLPEAQPKENTASIPPDIRKSIFGG